MTTMTRLGSGKKPSQILRSADPVKMPSGLTPDERVIWRRWAPLAMAKRTLTPQTLPGFIFLIEREVERRAMKAAIDRDGPTATVTTTKGETTIETIIANPLLSSYYKLAKLIEVNLARFGLAPFGKAEPELPKPAPFNPWSEIGR